MDHAGNGHGELAEIREHTRVMLQPIAAPSILGLFGFAGATFVVAAHLAGVGWWETAGGWTLIGSSIAAACTAGAMMLESAWGRVVLPLGTVDKEANVPGAKVTRPIQYEHQEPGVRMGQ